MSSASHGKRTSNTTCGCEIHPRQRRSDNDAVIPEFLGVKFVFTNTTTQGRHQIADLGGAQHLVKTRLLDIQNLSFKWQDRLKFAVTSLLR